LLDIDHFKRLNDEHGHQVGDQVLTEFAERLRAFCRSHDLVGRWGGEEFILILEGLDRQAARTRLQDLHTMIGSRSFYCEGEADQVFYVGVTATAGVAYYRSGDTFDSVISRADRALYRGKEQGRNQVVHID
jgi:diguanylate cyclase (GGDEF)-like protein